MSSLNRLLLVEDDVVDVMSMRRALRDLAITAPLTVAENGDRAIRLLREMRPFPSLILLDLNMPGMNGLELLRLLKSDDSTRHIPVVVLTTSQELRDRMESFKLGAAGYIAKPESYDEFVEIVRTIDRYWSTSARPDAV